MIPLGLGNGVQSGSNLLHNTVTTGSSSHLFLETSVLWHHQSSVHHLNYFYHSLIISYYLLPSVADLIAVFAIFMPVLGWFLPEIVESVGVDMGTAVWLTFGQSGVRAPALCSGHSTWHYLSSSFFLRPFFFYRKEGS